MNVSTGLIATMIVASSSAVSEPVSTQSSATTSTIIGDWYFLYPARVPGPGVQCMPPDMRVTIGASLGSESKKVTVCVDLSRAAPTLTSSTSL